MCVFILKTSSQVHQEAQVGCFPFVTLIFVCHSLSPSSPFTAQPKNSNVLAVGAWNLRGTLLKSRLLILPRAHFLPDCLLFAWVMLWDLPCFCGMPTFAVPRTDHTMGSCWSHWSLCQVQAQEHSVFLFLEGSHFPDIFKFSWEASLPILQ